MSNKLLWSWAIEDTRNALNKYNVKLPDWMGYVAIIIGFGAFIYIFNITIVPMSGNWILYVTAFFMFVALYLKMAGIKPKRTHGDGWYIKIYNDRISINIEDVYGSYDINNISIESLAIKYIAYWSYAGVSPVKGLCFKTINPPIAIKAPLVILLPGHIRELKNVLQTLKQTNMVAA